ncbi:MAG TPA: J domain-containing protein [Spirochaetia bacterium]|nr:J domain-containing protein [Spirochaetia bacterium]
MTPIAAGANLYDILGVPASATSQEIKSAYRKLSLEHHPDRNRNSVDSTVRFTIILNAYNVLSDAQARREYDAVTGAPASQRPISRSPAHANQTATRADAFDHLNFILWDIEDFIRAKHDLDQKIGNKPIGDYIHMMLAFIDGWVLETAGFPDYFYQARKMFPVSDIAATLTPGSTGRGTGHRPYVNLTDYFFAVRKRTDKLISSAKLIDLLATVPGKPVRLIDCVLEAHNYCAHYLACLRGVVHGTVNEIPAFHHPDSCYDE